MTACPKRKLVRDPKWRKHITTLACIACGKEGETQAAHIRATLGGGIGLKSSDETCVPLCVACHRRQHGMSERQFWREVGYEIDDILLLRRIVYQVWTAGK